MSFGAVFESLSPRTFDAAALENQLSAALSARKRRTISTAFMNVTRRMA